MTFTETLWSRTSDLQSRIQAMPFNAELADGTLPADTFRHYVVQDAHYLEGFARTLALAAARAPDADTIAQLAGSANGAIAVERQLHAHYMALYGVTAEAFASTPPSRACDHYVGFLLRTAALDPFPVAVAALLPCFWVYLEVGNRIHASAAADHPYRAWIDTYSGEDFAAGVARMIGLTDRLGAAADDAMRDRMAAAFRRSTWHEWMFWHSAYHRQGWPAPEDPA